MQSEYQGLLYDPKYEHGSCGVGFVADVSGRPGSDILQKALTCVRNVTHRGAVSADSKTGDGAGITTQIPSRLFQRELQKMGLRVAARDLAVGMVFLPGQDASARDKSKKIIGDTLVGQGLRLLGWRQVPVDAAALGSRAIATQPDIQQVLVARPRGLSDEEFERSLFLVRKDIESRLREARIEDCYIPSLSHRALVYKGLMVATQLPAFYADLRDPDFETALAVFHQRYSTNTFPNWYLAQPFRFLSHNGEINTVEGNCNWMKAREPELRSTVLGDDVQKLRPIIVEGGSDSAKLDNVLETLVMSGRDLLHSMMMLVPEAWENMPHMDPRWKAFYEYHACLTEPWDGPAALAFTDGVTVGACLDRNGLRPSRYKLTDGGLFVLGSEAGLLAIDDSQVVKKGRLGPGEMIAIDTRKGVLLTNEEIKNDYSTRHPYGQWVKKQVFHLDSPGVGAQHAAPSGSVVPPQEHAPPSVDTPSNLIQLQKAFGYTQEEKSYVLKPMVNEGKEPIFSMGDDTPIAVLAKKPRLLYSFFKQRFAQVTNPPIDPIREELVMSLSTYLGASPNLLEETASHARLLHLPSPVLFDHDIEAIRKLTRPEFASCTLSALFDVSQGSPGLEKALRRVCREASEAVARGSSIIILSDRGVDAAKAPIPMLLAVGAVHHHLIREGKRIRCSIVAETAEARDVHHFAALIGYGAAAVNPYLAFEVATEMVEAGDLVDTDSEDAVKNYRKSVEHGLLKVMSKMGISTLSSYQGAQIFEAIGLARDIVDLAFKGTTSPVGGIGLDDLAKETLDRHTLAFQADASDRLGDYGYVRFRKDGEYHGNNPEVVRALHAAVISGSYDAFKQFSTLVNSRGPMAIRDLLSFKPGESVPLDEVEPVEAIVHRFATASMSLGALSPEAHTTLAMGANRIGARSNTGEGGDDPARYWPAPSGDSPHSKIKQVASARFGVTTAYLASAEELEIKMAQGSKPGEGGQLPGHKVTAQIAMLRHAVPGIPLISPPPHHDIYSIEDLAQLIYDLKMVNPRARVSVKLVAEAGVGTIAAGVAKAYADSILISGDSGGTGASPLSSIKNAGSPWELGLAETQQVLVLNDLRGRVRLRTDGGLKTGRDVVIGAMFGAEEFTFGTAALMSVGCKMARQCHLNTCPVGVATQKEELRAKFFGKPGRVVHFLTHVAQEVREILASLGFRTLDEVVGRTDLLQQLPTEDPRGRLLDLRRLLASPDPTGLKPRRCMQERNSRPGDAPLDDDLLGAVRPALEKRKPVKLSRPITTADRTVGARVAGEIAFRYRKESLPDGSIEMSFAGSAGQSFGAFCTDGMRLVLHGEANDYVGKGMAGGEIVVRPPRNAAFKPHENVIVGNTVLYGATGGALFVSGKAGERFAVRNSGATAVVEGAGDHCCEYMTRGTVVVLGETGRNFGAGMTNGVAYVLDESGEFPKRYNSELVGLERVQAPADIESLQALIQKHAEKTGSPKAAEVLKHWDTYLPKFWKVVPNSGNVAKAAAVLEGDAGASTPHTP